MINAYLFIHLDSTADRDDILEDVRSIPEVKAAHRLYGSYDMVIYIETATTAELKKITLQSVRKLKFVESTTTFIALESYKKNN